MWQALRSELHPLGVEVVTVALDVDPEAARPSIEAATPAHPSLIDRSHRVDELFGIVNVTNSVWIDEDGTIVRPVESSNVQPSAFEIGELKAEDFPPEMYEAISRIKRDPGAYVAALRDWAAKGAASDWALEPHEVVARSTPRSGDSARAAAHFELGEHLHSAGERYDEQAANAVLSLLIFGISLRSAGWRIAFLGADTPIETIERAASELQPDAVVLSAVAPEHLLAVERDLTELARRTTVAIGGQGADPGLAERVGAVRLEADLARAAATFAHRGRP